MYTLAPMNVAHENGDYRTRFYRRGVAAPGMPFYRTWEIEMTDLNHLVRAALFIPNGVHKLVMYPFLWRNPDPEGRPLAWNYLEATDPPVVINGYHLGSRSINQSKVSQRSFVGALRKTSYDPYVESWRLATDAAIAGTPLANGMVETWSERDGEAFFDKAHQVQLFFTPHEARTLQRYLEQLQTALSDALEQRNQHPDFLESGMRPPWKSAAMFPYVQEPELNADDIRPLLFQTAREMASSLGLQSEDALYYLEGVDRHLARPFMWYFHHSLQEVLPRSDYYMTQKKSVKEFLGAVSDMRLPLQEHRVTLGYATHTLWLQRHAEGQGISLPYEQDQIVEARHNIDEALKAIVRWYLTAPAAYEDLVLSHGGPGAAQIVPDGIDFDERLQAVRQDLAWDRRSRHLLRT